METDVKTVLIVDDEATIRQSIVDYFEDCLWQVLTAESGEAAMALLEKESPLAAIVDIRMPGMGGNEFIRAAAQKKPEMLFLVYTGSPEYGIPSDIQTISRVYPSILKKGTNGMADLKNTLEKLIASHSPDPSS